MKLKRLIIHGFKSFKDKTTIHFDDKITGIVGPNGCGKSNIVDALFWVMGEQSAKHLRGKSMKDVIFAGSSKFKPGNWAMATLVIENTNGKHIHIGNKVCSPSEIELTRKLYRNGETEYRLNNEICRLKDIHEVFMDTGAGAKSYSIIAQGEINRMVQSKPEERRVMIEEVAGITKFKARKKESLKKMEQTSENIKRIDDLQQEIDKNLKVLQKQSEKAQRAKSLRAKIQNNDLIVHSHKEFDCLTEFKISKEAILQKESDLDAWIPEKKEIEISLSEEKLKKEIQEKNLKEDQSSYNETSRLLAASEERFNNICNNITAKETQIERREEELIQFNDEIEEQCLKSEQVKIELEELIASGALGFNYSDLEVEVDTLKERLDNIYADQEEMQASYNEKKEQLLNLENSIFKINSKEEEASNKISDLTEEIEDLESRYSSVSTNLDDQRVEIKTSSESLETILAEESFLKNELKEKNEKLKNLRLALATLEKNYMKINSKLSSLKEISKALDGANSGTSIFLTENESNDNNEHYDLLGNLIHCEEKYSKAVQCILGELLNSIVGSGENISNWLSHNGLNQTTQYIAYGKNGFYSEDEVSQRLSLKGLNVVPLSEILKSNLNTDPKISNEILKGHFVVEEINLTEILENLKEIQFKSISSLDGNILLKNINGSILVKTGLNAESGMGMVERNNLIESLTLEEAQVKKEKDSQTLELNELEDELILKQDLYELKREELIDLKTKVATIRSNYDLQISRIEESQAKLNILNDRKSKTSELRLEMLEQQEQKISEIELLKEEVEFMTEKLETIQTEYALNKDNLEEKKEELNVLKVAASTFEQKKTTFSSQIDDLDKMLIRTNEKKEKIQILLMELKEEKQSLDIEVNELEVSNLEKAQVLEDQGQVIKEQRKEVELLVREMKDRDDKVKKLTKIIASHEKDLVTHKSKRERAIEEEEMIVRDIFEKYRVDLRDVLKSFLNFDDSALDGLNDISNIFIQETDRGEEKIERETYEFTRKYGQDLKSSQEKFRRYKKELSQLGEINWQAMEDYERQKLRHDFLANQKEELAISLTDLETAIAQIDEKSKERFKIAFEEVTERFEKVFPIIFGGGSAKLSLVGNLNDVDCGIDIMASPPGKKMQNINLMSGGEKAMTAVSLIFSIFLVKPSPFCLLDEVDAPLDDANVGRFNELLREMSSESQFILITHNKKTMELNNKLYGVTMQEPGVSSAVSVHLQ